MLPKRMVQLCKQVYKFKFKGFSIFQITTPSQFKFGVKKINIENFGSVT